MGRYKSIRYCGRGPATAARRAGPSGRSGDRSGVLGARDASPGGTPRCASDGAVRSQQPRGAGGREASGGDGPGAGMPGSGMWGDGGAGRPRRPGRAHVRRWLQSKQGREPAPAATTAGEGAAEIGANATAGVEDARMAAARSILRGAGGTNVERDSLPVLRPATTWQQSQPHAERPWTDGPRDAGAVEQHPRSAWAAGRQAARHRASWAMRGSAATMTARKAAVAMDLADRFRENLRIGTLGMPARPRWGGPWIVVLRGINPLVS